MVHFRFLEQTRAVPRPYANVGVASSGKKTPSMSNSSCELSLVLEENAKWRLAADVLKEIRGVYDSRYPACMLLLNVWLCTFVCVCVYVRKLKRDSRALNLVKH